MAIHLPFLPCKRQSAKPCSFSWLRGWLKLEAEPDVHLYHPYARTVADFWSSVGALLPNILERLVSVGDKSPITLIDSEKGEEKAHTCVIGCSRQLRSHGA